MNKSEYESLVKTLNEYSKSYHLKDESTISDTEYDRLYKKLVQYEKDHPEDIVTNSPSQRVGETVTENKVVHYARMYSLENAFSEKDLIRYLNRFTKLRRCFGSEVDTYYVDYKMDGLSCEIIYNDGGIEKCITRGDGMYGEDVTPNALTIDSIPKEIGYKKLLIVRGEVVVKHEDFDRINAERLRNNLPVFSNCRNYASGSLRQKDPTVTRHRKLQFYAWDAFVPGKELKHNEKMDVLVNLGFQIPASYLCHTLNDIMAAIRLIASAREKLPFDIDGVVIKQNDPAYYKEIGWNAHAPLFSIAFKFPPKAVNTKVIGVRWNMGRTGKLTPVASIQPIQLDGVTVKNVTLNNADFMETNGIGEGAEVSVSRSADVIPKISQVITQSSVHIPENCPYCGKPLTRNGPMLQCTNIDCAERLKAKLTYMLGKDCLNIKGYGEKFVAALIDSKTVTSFLNIFTFMDTKSASIRQESLDSLVYKIRDIDLANLLCLLDIPNLGKVTALKLVQEEPTLSKLCGVLGDLNKLSNININEASRISIADWYAEKTNQEFINKIIELELPNC